MLSTMDSISVEWTDDVIACMHACIDVICVYNPKPLVLHAFNNVIMRNKRIYWDVELTLKKLFSPLWTGKGTVDLWACDDPGCSIATISSLISRCTWWQHRWGWSLCATRSRRQESGVMESKKAHTEYHAELACVALLRAQLLCCQETWPSRRPQRRWCVVQTKGRGCHMIRVYVVCVCMYFSLFSMFVSLSLSLSLCMHVYECVWVCGVC